MPQPTRRLRNFVSADYESENEINKGSEPNFSVLKQLQIAFNTDDIDADTISEFLFEVVSPSNYVVHSSIIAPFFELFSYFLKSFSGWHSFSFLRSAI